jgi:uncharacterized protein YdiU (UPF0061 family)
MKNLLIALSFCTFTTTHTMFSMIKAKCQRKQQKKTLTMAINTYTKQLGQRLSRAMNDTLDPEEIGNKRNRQIIRLILLDLASKNMDLTAEDLALIQQATPAKKEKRAIEDAQEELSESELKIEAEQTELVDGAEAPTESDLDDLVVIPDAAKATAAPEVGEASAQTTQEPTTPAPNNAVPTEKLTEATATAIPQAKTASPERYFFNPLGWVGW